MGYSIDSTTSGCYEGTTCLVNKLGVTNENILAQIEADITFAKASQLEANAIKGNFDFNHYKAIHEYLFSDLYDWAGKIRTINISKKGTNFIDFAEIDPDEIMIATINSANGVTDLLKQIFKENIKQGKI